jgi:type IV secretory pathway VirB6-like protein
MTQGSMSDFFAFLSQLMTEHASLFETFGNHLFRGLAIIMIAWFGIKHASAAPGGHASAVHLDRFASLLMSISFGYAMITYYSQPLPVIGISFYHLIVDQGLSFANELNHTLLQNVWDRLTGLYWGVETPGLTLALNMMELIPYGVTVLCLIIAQAATFGVIAFGYIAAAIAVLLGPIFIPFYIVPGLEWLFWGWFKALIQYAFYPVVANACVFVFGNLLINFIDSHPPPYDGAGIAVMFFPLLMMLIAFTYGVVKIPSLVNSLFAGRSGETTAFSF